MIRPNGFIGMIFGGMKPAHSGIHGLYFCSGFRVNLDDETLLQTISKSDTIICETDTIRATFEIKQDSTTGQMEIYQVRIKGRITEDENESKRIEEQYCECVMSKLIAN